MFLQKMKISDSYPLYIFLRKPFSSSVDLSLTPDESSFLTFVNLTCSLTLVSSFPPWDPCNRKWWPWRSCGNICALVSVKHFQRGRNDESRLWEAMLEFEPQKTFLKHVVTSCWRVRPGALNVKCLSSCC